MKQSHKGVLLGIVVALSCFLSPAVQAEQQKIAFISANMANESQAFSSKQFQKYAKDYGFEAVVLDAKGDAQAESQRHRPERNESQAGRPCRRHVFVRPSTAKSKISQLFRWRK